MTCAHSCRHTKTKHFYRTSNNTTRRITRHPWSSFRRMGQMIKVAIVVLFCVSGLQLFLHQRSLSLSSSSAASKVIKLHVASSSNFDERKAAAVVSLHASIPATEESTTKTSSSSTTSTLTRNRPPPPPLPENNHEAAAAAAAAVLLSQAKPIIKIRAATGGVLPLSPRYNHSDPSTWPAIDNETCRGGGGGEAGKQRQPLYEWQRRAPYAMLLGTMKGAL